MAKEIPNKIANITPGQTPTYGELIMSCVKQPGMINGQLLPLDYETIKKIKRIDDVIGNDKLVEKYEFEDADYEFVKSKVQSMGWGLYSPEIIKFVDTVLEAK